MSVSFLDGAIVQRIRNDILKLNLGVTFDASQIGEGQSVFSDRGGFATVNQVNPNIVDEPRPLDLQLPLSISLIRNNKYNSSEDGYRLVSIDQNPSANLSNENKTEYFELVQPYIGLPISEGGSRTVDIKSLILNGQINTYKDTPLGLVGIRALDRLLKENIAANVEAATVGRFNTDPISLLKGNSLIIPNRTITQVSEPKSPTDFLKAGINTTNEYLGYTTPVSLIPESALSLNDDIKNFNSNQRSIKTGPGSGSSKFANFLNNITKNTAKAISNVLSVLGAGNPNDLSTEERMDELLKYTGDGQKELIFRNLSQNQYQPGYEYRQSIASNKKLANFQANTIQNNVINRGTASVYSVLGTKERYGLLGFKGAYDLQNDDVKSVLKKNGMVRITPEKTETGYIKNYMFSIENLAWADVPDAFMDPTEIGVGDPSSGIRGKIMWFPPYDLSISDDASASWGEEQFLGRPEPVFTYNNSSRGGSLSFKIVVDHPSIINLARGTQSDVLEKYFSGELKIKDLPPLTTVPKNEDEKRGFLKKVFGNKKRKSVYNGDKQSSSSNPESSNTSGLPVNSNNPIPQSNAAPGKKETKEPSNFYSGIENNWFKELEVKDQIVFKYLAEKIQYFHPAFHSTSPEGFNSRLTFLHQCLRQGPSITEGGKATGNLAFGRPPICILRVGDFYNTKVAFDSLGISYDEAPWDLNPDGIGVQPMIASITMNFKYIGGSSLTGPINKLQNAVSFNFFANTEVYETRSQYWSKEKVTDETGKEKEVSVLKTGLNLNTINNQEIKKSELGNVLKSSSSGDQIAQNNKDSVESAGGQNTIPTNNNLPPGN